jgi:tripartite-type tricarboxylate transporter receptor subunit TctC
MNLLKAALMAFALSFVANAMAQTGSAAQSYPTKPIRIIVTTPAGSAGDFFLRIIADGLSDLYKQQVLVENRPGAGGLIGASAIVSASPDGYTIGIASIAHMVSPMLQKKPPYRPIEDVTPIALITAIPSVVIVNANVPAKDVRQLVALAKSKPGVLNFASLGDGTATHLAAVIFNNAAGVPVTHVPFRNVSDMQTALMSGEVHYAVLLVPIAAPVLRAERGRALAITSRSRSTALPDVPTLAESGITGGESDAFVGLVGPANMNPEIVRKLNADIGTVLRKPETRERFATQGAVPILDTTPEQFGAMLKSEHERYRELISALGLQQR